jgi:hypothetical protein
MGVSSYDRASSKVSISLLLRLAWPYSQTRALMMRTNTKTPVIELTARVLAERHDRMRSIFVDFCYGFKFVLRGRRQLVVEILRVDARRADIRRTCTLP